MTPLCIEPGDLTSPDVRALLAEHLTDMYATSPPESVHALDTEALQVPEVTFWTVRKAGVLLGCGALRRLTAEHGEIKSMRTARHARGTGVASRLLDHITAEARRRGYARLSLETGAQPYFAPARRLYRGRGFVDCAPFGDYAPDPNSVFLTLPLGGTPVRR
ncbi:GNAT family N-acetyltransferase [Actinocatenispora rupis]|uniref:N-acetyltransferase n=1 Tax=Actinocatenispora rupis TaxID=519421 RepID=A0A8J3J578_9ACTN|nr:GNAT family N-acetyltransferase [Actinocatenispora rupis]GID14970.1 N-acetyltransferase [Actinocatenispora rupis]